MRTKAIAILVMALGATVFDAQASGGALGGSSCGEWLQEVQQRSTGKPDPSSSFWLLGYLSGLSIQSNRNFLEGTDSASLFAWVTNYCQKSPLDQIFEAGNALANELRRKKRL